MTEAMNRKIRIGNQLREFAAVAGLLAAATSAQAAPAATDWSAQAFSSAPADEVYALSAAEMAETQGRFALLPFIGLVVGTDLALASFYWGVYVPTITGGCGECSGLVHLY